MANLKAGLLYNKKMIQFKKKRKLKYEFIEHHQKRLRAL